MGVNDTDLCWMCTNRKEVHKSEVDQAPPLKSRNFLSSLEQITCCLVHLRRIVKESQLNILGQLDKLGRVCKDGEQVSVEMKGKVISGT